VPRPNVSRILELISINREEDEAKQPNTRKLFFFKESMTFWKEKPSLGDFQ